MKHTKLLILILLTVFVFPAISSCTSKEERCDQVAFAMMKYGYIPNRVYQSKGIQKACVQQWDTVCIPSVHGDCGKIKDNSDWRDCILDADSKEEMSPCGFMYIKAAKFR